MNEAEALAHKALTEKYLKKFTNFLENHSLQLQKNLENFDKGNFTASEDNSSSSPANLSKSILKKSFEFRSDLSKNINCNPDNPIIELSIFQENPFFSEYSTEKVFYEILKPTSSSSLEFDEESFSAGEELINVDVNKVILILFTLTTQSKSLIENNLKKFIDKLILFGDPFDNCKISTENLSKIEGDNLIEMANFLPTLFDLVHFIQDSTDLCSHIIIQLASLFKDSKPHVVCINGLYLPTVFRTIADLLSVPVIFDEIISSQFILQELCTKYKRMIKSVGLDACSKFEIEKDSVLKLEKELNFLEENLIKGNIFKKFIEKICQKVKGVSKNSALAERFSNQIINMGLELEKDWPESGDFYKPISLSAFFHLSTILFSPNVFDAKKTFSKTWEILKKIMAVHIRGFVLWTPEKFFSFRQEAKVAYLSSMESKACSNARITFLQNKVAKLPTEILGYNVHISGWAVRLNESLLTKEPSQLTHNDLLSRGGLLIQGLKLSRILTYNFSLIINLHTNIGRSVTKLTVSLLCQILELLKHIDKIFSRYNVLIANSCLLIIQQLCYIGISNVRGLYNYFGLGKNIKKESGAFIELRSGILSALNCLELCLQSPLTPRKFILARIAFDWVSSGCFRLRLGSEVDEILSSLGAALEKCQTLLEIKGRIKEISDGTSLLWHYEILSAYYAEIYSKGMEEDKLRLIFHSVKDCAGLLENVCTLYKNNFLNQIQSTLKSNFIDKICTDVEIDLRLQSHSHLQTQSRPFLSAEENKSKNCIVSIMNGSSHQSLNLNGTKINLKILTEYYLSKTFYNLASVALHDWGKYASMRVIANEKYLMNVLEDHLPGKTIEQGMDILEIVKSLDKFVSGFTYNLNNQVFVQINSSNKHLDTVNIRHLANSIRTNGSGIASTAVNFTYHFLRAKIHIFSQFLYDEQIKSRLAKDLRLFKQACQQSDNNQHFFPYERALKFQTGIRKLGQNSEGFSCLDRFRLLITHIGNALGFVRLLRSGGLHYLSSGCRFVPDLNDITNFDEILKAENENLDKNEKDLKDALVSVDLTLKTLSSSFTGGVDYFNLLVSAFSSALRTKGNSHLKNFFVIIPALTLSYIDHMRVCKDKLSKKTKSSTTIFTDDGFPMGVAFLLKVLGQEDEFDSLQWFPEVNLKLEQKKHLALKTIQEAKKDEKLQQANTLTAKRVTDLVHEFHLLRCNLSSARIFFQFERLIQSI